MLRTILVALVLISSNRLAAQATLDLEQRRAALIAAASALRTAPAPEQVAALQKIAALARDESEAVELRIAGTLATALGSRDREVVAAGIAALLTIPDRSGCRRELTQHLRGLHDRLKGKPTPQWPVLELKMPPSPPLDGSKRAQQDYAAKLRAFERAKKQALERHRSALARAEADEKKVLAAAGVLADFAGHLASVRDDAVVDELVRALNVMLVRTPNRCGPIVGTLCATGRRDAVARCAAILSQPNLFHRSVTGDFRRSLAYAHDGSKAPETDSREGEDPGAVRLHLSALSIRHGVPVPGPELMRKEDLRALLENPTSEKPIGPWKEWFDRIAPKLPERLAAPAEGSVTVAIGKAQDTPRIPEPCLRIWLHEKDAFSANTKVHDVIASVPKMAQGFGDERLTAWFTSLMDLLAKEWAELRVPLQLSWIVERDFESTLLLQLPSGSRPFLPRLQKLVADAKAVSAPVDGKTFSGVVGPGFMTVLEGEHESGHLLLVSFAEGDQTGRASALIAATKQSSPGTRRLQKFVSGRGAELLFNLEVLLSIVPQRERAELGVLTTLLGSRMPGFVARLTARGEQVQNEVFVDLRPGQGALGSLLQDDGKGLALLGWVPAEQEEFAGVRFAMKGVVSLLRLAAASLDVSLDPSEWGEGCEKLKGTDVGGLLEEHLTGEVLFLSTASRPEDVLDPEAEVPTVFVLGTPDGAKALQAVHDFLAKTQDAPQFAPAAGLGEGVMTMKIDGEPAAHLVARPGFLAFADVDARSAAILKGALATMGKGKLPAAFRNRHPSVEGSVAMVALGHMLSSLHGRTIMRDVAGTPIDARARHIVQLLIDELGRRFAGERGMSADVMTIGEDGIRFRSIW